MKVAILIQMLMRMVGGVDVPNDVDGGVDGGVDVDDDDDVDDDGGGGGVWCGGVDDGGDVDYVSTSSVAPSFIAFKSHSRFGSSLESRSAIKIDKK